MRNRHTMYSYYKLIPIVVMGLLSACGGGSGSNDLSYASDRAVAGVVVGSGNVLVADPTVTRPSTTPCSVDLFKNMTFANFDPKAINYAPPSCQGPWAKVVLEADFSVTQGRQFDRSAYIDLGGVNLYTGTTQEPSATVAPSWHVERDVTDYSSLFTQSQQGRVELANLVDQTYTGVITGSAKLVFYPTSPTTVVPPTADAIYALSSTGGQHVDAKQDSLSQTLTLPTNIVRAYLDVLAQGQSDDEFWYTCAPDDLATPLYTCGHTPFRETEVSIDDQPAGVAPVFPWIFTGGISPALWRPTPGVQTLNMKPYRVDLSPFAGILSDGKPHKVSIRVANVSSYFFATATLLIFRDPVLSQVTGGVINNTLDTSLAPKIDSQLTFDSANNANGQLLTTSHKDFVISGFINSSKGYEQLDVKQTVDFSNTQKFTATTQDFVQSNDVDTTSTVTAGRKTFSLQRSSHFPLHFSYAADGSKTAIGIDFADQYTHILSNAGKVDYRRQLDNAISSQTSSAGTPVVSTRHSTQHYVTSDSLGSCFDRRVEAIDMKASLALDKGGCSGVLLDKPWLHNVRPDASQAIVNGLLILAN
ncbi:peptide-N4-asparagine amidase [Aquirhabdus parva]|uniref:Peptide-N(4)-(N-acetyl-beta-glucosaminyl)asparagine amidase n=1 Tax=Aquirhabdus parva TaxID=2283318 RepID=A0A345P8Z0_9GAMM|nr:peptide-N4-asparagine amidase [Aquirhabdus parva]AXI03749.1 peptide-N(4)-(N-acetyl-beta-glucosaminyl)asparagine amidase [Aquirhabdus parva]